MKLFLSGMENDRSVPIIEHLERNGIKPLYNLLSYYYVRRKGGQEVAEFVRDHSELIMVDSGAHSFQKGTKVEWVRYTHEYAEWIRGFDRENVVGYFEMDVDNIVGLDKVRDMRRILETESGHPEKIIPVWHKNRGIEDFKRMCREKAGHTAAITGWKNEDIKDEQYPMFLKYAWGQGTKLHCLGMSRTEVLRKVPFDYADASSWVQNVIYGRSRDGYKLRKPTCYADYVEQYIDSYETYMRIQRQLELRWSKC